MQVGKELGMLGSGNTKGFHRASWRNPHSEGTNFDSCDLIVLNQAKKITGQSLKIDHSDFFLLHHYQPPNSIL
jgi:hypothetical protein